MSEELDRTPDVDAIKISLGGLAIVLFAILVASSAAESPMWLLLPAVLIAGLVASVATRNVFYVRISTRVVQVSAPIALAVMALYAAVELEVITSDEARTGFLLGVAILTAACAAGILLLNILWLNPVRRKFSAISDFATNIVRREPVSSPRIISRENLVSFSNADELRKWNDLRDSGAITQNEFDRMKAKLLKDAP